MKIGLVSVSFRGLAPEAIIDLAAECGLGGVEWGGDVHVPCGDLRRAVRGGLRAFETGGHCGPGGRRGDEVTIRDTL